MKNSQKKCVLCYKNNEIEVNHILGFFKESKSCKNGLEGIDSTLGQLTTFIFYKENV